MSFLVGAVLNSAIQAAVSSAGTVLYYGASGVWWAGKRVLYGRQPTIEEQQALILAQQSEILKRLEEKK